MASDDNKSRITVTRDDEENLFIAFRRFADEQVASLLQAVIGLPSALTPQSSTARWLPQEEGLRRRINDDWGLPSPPEERSEAADGQKGSQEAQDENETLGASMKADVTRSNDEKSIEDTLLLWPYWLLQQEIPDKHPLSKPSTLPPNFLPLGNIIGFGPNTAELLSDQYRTVRWPISYLISSRYSPLYLEQQEGFREQGLKWRNAFEDLIAISRGKEMVDDEQRCDQYDSCDWIESMVGRGSFGPWQQLRLAHREINDPHPVKELESKQSVNDVAGGRVTELDLYERFLGSQGRLPVSTDSSTIPSSQKSTAKSGGDKEMSGIVSMLTTTERKVMQDGTIHTKVIFKKRFADGREESSETVHMTQSQPNQESLPAVITLNQNQNPHGDQELETRKAEKSQKGWLGWFWS